MKNPIKYFMLLLTFSGLVACNEDEEPAIKFIDENCRVKLIRDDFVTKTFHYEQDVIAWVNLDYQLPYVVDGTYSVTYHANMLEVEMANDFVDRAYLKNGLLVKRIKGRIFNTDPPYWPWVTENEYFYNDQWQLFRVIVSTTNNIENEHWEEIFEIEWVDGNIRSVSKDGSSTIYSFDEEKNPFAGNMALIMLSEWNEFWTYNGWLELSYFNANNITSIEKPSGFKDHFSYIFNNSVYPTSITNSDDLITVIGYLCQ
jgi:hypothetical protein